MKTQLISVPDSPSSIQTYPTLEDSADWNALLAEFDRLNPGFIRFGIPPLPGEH